VPIEFRCTDCERLLRTPDGTSGKEAKCPQCGAIVRIPTPAVAPPARENVPSSAPMPVVANPYQSPSAADADRPPAPSEQRHTFEPTQIEIGDVLNRTWEIFKVQWPVCLAVVWGPAAITLILCGIVVSLTLPVLAPAGRKPGPEFFAVFLFVYPVAWWQFVAVHGLMLKIARGEKAAVRDLYSFGGAMIPGFVAVALSALASMVGLVLLIVPGVMIMLMFSQCFDIVIDRRAGIVESLRLSMQATQGNKLTLFLLSVLVSAIGGVCTLFTCGLAAVALQPFILLMQSVAYLAMTGQKTAIEPRAERERRLG
jgi:phage FluMu protein Com